MTVAPASPPSMTPFGCPYRRCHAPHARVFVDPATLRPDYPPPPCPQTELRKLHTRSAQAAQSYATWIRYLSGFQCVAIPADEAYYVTLRCGHCDTPLITLHPDVHDRGKTGLALLEARKLWQRLIAEHGEAEALRLAGVVSKDYDKRAWVAVGIASTSKGKGGGDAIKWQQHEHEERVTPKRRPRKPLNDEELTPTRLRSTKQIVYTYDEALDIVMNEDPSAEDSESPVEAATHAAIEASDTHQTRITVKTRSPSLPINAATQAGNGRHTRIAAKTRSPSLSFNVDADIIVDDNNPNPDDSGRSAATPDPPSAPTSPAFDVAIFNHPEEMEVKRKIYESFDPDML
ncbi:hypothetical protein FN846DRAFT_910060 [Sphaerosporella brunnea]|uniref:Uncharacterized protein n=1 Tax=Sphaerosporella brunnea TaxID=1250544 RepID=A0A5J5EPD2_9PEZI|nr:hypothetical protein FN846DRAFT_910060 [Sphaerosporella brunnea]